METKDEFGENPTLPGTGDNQEHHDHKELPRGSSIDRYLIVEPIGSGGMGAVYRAYDPKLNRGIALKILSVKHEDLAAAERAKTRLIREAQALAQLSHPNVVAVHDYGSFGDDVFIAMELVEGSTINDWLKLQKRTIKEIIGVMTAAGRGLSAAHKAGLVHRDFKPANVIVGDDGRVRVLDFGLARARDENPEEAAKESEKYSDMMEISSDSSPDLLQTPLTKVGGIVGTPLYMAPEQHLGLKTDERTDQFGFCLVLYEALYGKRPFVAGTMEELKSAVIGEQICIPPADTTVPAWLWEIIRRGLSVEPEDRYLTLESLLEELEHDPEEVGRQQRQSRRRKVFVISLIILTIALPIGVWYGLRYRTVQLCKATDGELDGVWDEVTKASVQTAFLGTKIPYALGTLERVKRIFGNYLNDWMRMRSDVCEARIIRGTQSEELFDLRMSCLKERKKELQALAKSFTEADADVVQKAVQASSSLSSINICADEKALRAPYPPPKTPEDKIKVSAIRAKLAEVEALSKTGKYKKGLDLAKELKERAKTVAYQPVQAEVLFQLGKLFYKIGDFKTAETTLYDAACAAGESRDSRLAAWASTFLVSVVGYAQGRPDAGLLIGRFAKFIIELGGGDDALRSRYLNNLGGVLWNEGDYDNSLNHFRNALEIQKKVFGPKHPEVASTLNNIGAIYYIIGYFDKSLEYYRRSLVIREKVLGMEHPDVALSLNNIGLTFAKLGEYDEALLNHKRALGIREKSLGPEHPDVAHSLLNQGLVLAELGDHDMALHQIQKSLAIRKKALGNQHSDVAQVNSDLGIVLAKHGEYGKALFHFRKALTIWEAVLGPRHPDVTWPLSGIGSILVEQGKPKQAHKNFERVVRLCEKRHCETTPHSRSLFGLARALVATGGDKVRAIKLAKQAREIYGKTSRRFKKELEEVDTWLTKHDGSAEETKQIRLSKSKSQSQSKSGSSKTE